MKGSEPKKFKLRQVIGAESKLPYDQPHRILTDRSNATIRDKHKVRRKLKRRGVEPIDSEIQRGICQIEITENKPKNEFMVQQPNNFVHAPVKYGRHGYPGVSLSQKRPPSPPRKKPQSHFGTMQWMYKGRKSNSSQKVLKCMTMAQTEAYSPYDIVHPQSRFMNYHPTGKVGMP